MNTVKLIAKGPRNSIEELCLDGGHAMSKLVEYRNHGFRFDSYEITPILIPINPNESSKVEQATN